jgi:enoyl-CoA hydratase/carnithine racemase
MRMRQYIESLQECISSIERVPVPVIAAVHGYCVGAGVDLITACDIRICSEDARFCVKEVDLGIAADMGTLSRLPGICGDGIARELCLTASTITATRAYEIHLVSQVCETHDALLENARVLAKSLAAKSPVAIAGTKECLLYHRDHGNVKDSLTYVAMMNAAMLPGNKDIDMIMSKKKNRFSKL